MELGPKPVPLEFKTWLWAEWNTGWTHQEPEWSLVLVQQCGLCTWTWASCCVLCSLSNRPGSQASHFCDLREHGDFFSLVFGPHWVALRLLPCTQKSVLASLGHHMGSRGSDSSLSWVATCMTNALPLLAIHPDSGNFWKQAKCLKVPSKWYI